MGSKIKKQYLPLGGMPVLSRTISVFDQCGLCKRIFLVVPEEDMSFCREHVIDPFSFDLPLHLVTGGNSRQDSVYHGLAAARQTAEDMGEIRDEKKPVVLVHDGVRPLVSRDLIFNCLEKAVATGSCIPVLPCMDTVKSLDVEEQMITGTLERRSIGFAQTPQVFDMDVLFRAFAHAGKTHFTGTDEASLLEHAGEKVSMVQGDSKNIKLTTTADLAFARYLLKGEDGFF